MFFVFPGSNVRRETERACALWQREWRTGGLVPVLVNLFLFTLLSSGKPIVVSFNFFPDSLIFYEAYRTGGTYKIVAVCCIELEATIDLSHF
jgi:hypothetical protein